MLLVHLKTFIRIVESGSLTRAAEQLNLTQPAVTKQLAQLEEEFHTQLLVRQGRKFYMTPTGEVFYHYAKRVLLAVDQTYEAIEEMERPGQGEIHIAAVATVAVFSLPQVLSGFTRNFPHLRVRVKIGEIQENLDGVVKGEQAVGLVTVPIIHEQIDSIPLFSDPVRLVVSPQRARELPATVNLQDVAQMEFISYQTPSRFRSYVDGVLEQHGVIPKVLMEFNSHDVIKSMVKVGLGAAMVPDSVVRDDIFRGELHALNVENLPPIMRTTSLIVLKDPPRTAALRALLETFVTHYQVPRHLWPGWLEEQQ